MNDTEILEKIKELINTTPNNYDLGREIRKIINKNT